MNRSAAANRCIQPVTCVRRNNNLTTERPAKTWVPAFAGMHGVWYPVRLIRNHADFLNPFNARHE